MNSQPRDPVFGDLPPVDVADIERLPLWLRPPKSARFSLTIGGIPIYFESRESLDKAMEGLVEPTPAQIKAVDKALAQEGVLLSKDNIKRNISACNPVKDETTGCSYWRSPQSKS